MKRLYRTRPRSNLMHPWQPANRHFKRSKPVQHQFKPFWTAIVSTCTSLYFSLSPYLLPFASVNPEHAVHSWDWSSPVAYAEWAPQGGKHKHYIQPLEHVNTCLTENMSQGLQDCITSIDGIPQVWRPVKLMLPTPGLWIHDESTTKVQQALPKFKFN